MKQKRTRQEILDQDAQDLKELGYGQQLLREMGGFSNFALSFSIISILTGAVILYGHGLKFAGPIINTVGWPVASLFTLFIAASMAELASAYPTAGGLYFWAFRLGGRGWAWVTAWLNMVGQVAITAGINIAAATYIIGAVVRFAGLPEDQAVPLFGNIKNWYFIVTVMVLIMIPQVLINIYGIRLTARLTNFSAYWHMAGVAVIVLLILALGKHLNPLSFLMQSGGTVNPLDSTLVEVTPGNSVPGIVFGEIKVASPLFALFPALKELYSAAPFGLVFMLGLLQAQWTYTGYDASAHVAEETMMARLNSAWGVFLSVAVSAVVGYILLLSLTLRIPNGDLAKTANDGYPVLYIAYENLPLLAGHAVAIIIGVAMWLCGLASITSMARMWWAFARDDGMPGAGMLKQVHERFGVPVNATLITCALAVVTCLYSAAYAAIGSISTITLYLAYGIPIYLNWRNGLRGSGESTLGSPPPWNLGRWGRPINAVGLVWIGVLTVVFSLPPNELVLWSLLLLVVLLAVYWAVHAGRHFTGPTPEDEAILRMEAESSKE